MTPQLLQKRTFAGKDIKIYDKIKEHAKYKVALYPGHFIFRGTRDQFRGKYSITYGYFEAFSNLLIAKYIVEYIDSHFKNIDAIMVRGNLFEKLKPFDLVNRALLYEPDIILSIHCNWNKNRNVRGSEMYISHLQAFNHEQILKDEGIERP